MNHKLTRKATKEDIIVGSKLIDSDGKEFEIVVGTKERANLSSEFVMWNEDFGFRVDTPNTIRSLYLPPLAWVLSKPVYKGDKLWTKDGDEVTVLESDGVVFKTTPSKCGCTTFTKDFLRWEKPTKEFTCFLVLKKDGTAYTASTDYMLNSPDIAEIRKITWEVKEFTAETFDGEFLTGICPRYDETIPAGMYPENLTFTPPKPKTRQFKMLCYFTGASLAWYSEGSPTGESWIRVHAKDITIEVEE